MVIEPIEIDGAHLPARSCLAVSMETRQGEQGLALAAASCMLEEGPWRLLTVSLGLSQGPKMLPLSFPSSLPPRVNWDYP